MKKILLNLCSLFIAVLLLAGVAAADSYEEPLTGTVITFPSVFDGGQTFTQSDSKGMVHSVLAGHWPDAGGQINISVREINAGSIGDVADNAFFHSPNSISEYEIHELSETTVKIFQEYESAFGDVTYYYHQAWLLNDGSCLYVGFETEREVNKGHAPKHFFEAETQKKADVRMEF